MTDTRYRFLFVNLPYSGHINPTIPLAKLLVEAGHDVDYVLDSSFKDTIEETGATLIPYEYYDPEWSELHKYMKAFKAAYKTAITIGSENDYDCLIFEAYFIFGYNLSRELSIPAIRLFSTFAFNNSLLSEVKETGGPHFSFMQSKNPLYSLFVKYYENKKDMMVTNDFFSEMAEGVQDLNIVYTSREFQPQSEAFSEDVYSFVGPSIEDNYSDDMPSVPFDKLSSKVIYVALGSLMPRFARKIYQNCIDSFNNEKVSLIMSIGDELDESDFDHVTDSVYLYSKVPQIDVLKRSDIFITHGGMNSVNEGLFLGVPMLVHPIVNDEPLIARQLKKLNVAEELDLRKADPSEIRDTVFNLMKNESVAAACAEMKEIMQSLGSNEKARELIFDYLKDK